MINSRPLKSQFEYFILKNKEVLIVKFFKRDKNNF